MKRIQLLLASVAAMATSAYGSPKKSLALAWETAPRAIDPRYATDADSQYLEDLIHCSLIGYDPDGKIVSRLAESWNWTSPTTLRITLKKGVTFSDGTAVTAADVKATYDFFAKTDVNPPSPRRGAFSLVSSIEAPNPQTVNFLLKEADATFATNLSVGILPAALAQGPMIAVGKPITGCGPFVVDKIDVGDLELKRNEKFSLGPLPKLERVEIKIVKDETTRFAKLRKGELDVVQNLLSRDQVGDIAKKHPALQVLRRPGLNTAYLGFNMRDPILSQQAVRQAIAVAVNRPLIIKHVLNGLAIPATTLITPADPFFEKSLTTTQFDPAMARKLLDEAGLKDPDGPGPKPRFTLTYKTTTNATRVQVGRAIADNLKDIGIQVTVQPLEWGKFKDDVDKGNVQLWSLNWVGFKDPDIYRFAFATESFPPNGGNRGWFSNTALDKLLSEARSSTDESKRRKIYSQVQSVVNTEMPYVFLWHEEVFAVTTKSVKGFELYADGRFSSLARASKE